MGAATGLSPWRAAAAAALLVLAGLESLPTAAAAGNCGPIPTFNGSTCALTAVDTARCTCDLGYFNKFGTFTLKCENVTGTYAWSQPPASSLCAACSTVTPGGPLVGESCVVTGPVNATCDCLSGYHLAPTGSYNSTCLPAGGWTLPKCQQCGSPPGNELECIPDPNGSDAADCTCGIGYYTLNNTATSFHITCYQNSSGWPMITSCRRCGSPPSPPGTSPGVLLSIDKDGYNGAPYIALYSCDSPVWAGNSSTKTCASVGGSWDPPSGFPVCVSTSQSPTPTASTTPSRSVTASPSTSKSITPSPSVTRSITRSASHSPSVTPSFSPSPSNSKSNTPSPSHSPSLSPSPSNTKSNTASPSHTRSVSPSLSPSPSNSRSNTPSHSVTASNTPSPSVTASETKTITPTRSTSPSPSVSPSVAATVSPSASTSPVASGTPSPSVTPSVTPSSTGSASPAASIPYIVPSGSGTVTVSPSATSSSSASPSLSAIIPPPKKEDDDDTGAIIGGIVGGLLALLALLLLLFCLRRRRRNRRPMAARTTFRPGAVGASMPADAGPGEEEHRGSMVFSSDDKPMAGRAMEMAAMPPAPAPAPPPPAGGVPPKGQRMRVGAAPMALALGRPGGFTPGGGGTATPSHSVPSSRRTLQLDGSGGSAATPDWAAADAGLASAAVSASNVHRHSLERGQSVNSFAPVQAGAASAPSSRALGGASRQPSATALTVENPAAMIRSERVRMAGAGGRAAAPAGPKAVANPLAAVTGGGGGGGSGGSGGEGGDAPGEP